MAQNHETPNQTHITSRLRRRGVALRRRRVLPSVRLGGKKGFVLIRGLRVGWLKMQYACMMKKLKLYYKNLVKDLVEAGATYESFHQRLLMEASFAIPVMPLSYPSLR